MAAGERRWRGGLQSAYVHRWLATALCQMLGLFVIRRSPLDARIDTKLAQVFDNALAEVEVKQLVRLAVYPDVECVGAFGRAGGLGAGVTMPC